MPPESASDREKVGARIKATRMKAGLNAKQLAEAADISPSYLAEVEQGISAISGEKLLRIAKALGVTVRFLLEGIEDPLLNQEIRIPAPLSELADELDLAYGDTLALLRGKQSLVARRSDSAHAEWTKEDWKKFYKKVKDIMEG